jgi:hypothetical protein
MCDIVFLSKIMNHNILALAGGAVVAVLAKTVISGMGSSSKNEQQESSSSKESKAPPKDPLMEVVGFRYAALGTDPKIANLFLSLSTIQAYVQQPLTELAKEVDSLMYTYNAIKASQGANLRNWAQDMVAIEGFTRNIDKLIMEIRSLLVDVAQASIQFETFRVQLDEHIMKMRTMLYSMLNT